MKSSQEKTTSPVIEAAGGLLWRNSDYGREIAIIHRPHRNDWTLPKGKMNPGESWQAAALREVWEETGYQVKLDSFAGSVAYTFNGVAKVVLFWHMSLVQEGNFKPNIEVDQLIWLPAADALKKLNYQGEKALVQNVMITRAK